MKKSRILIGLLLITALLLAMVGCGQNTAGETSQPAAEGNSFTLTVVFADGSEKEFSYTTTTEYLGEFLQQEGLLEGYMGPYGLYIESVAGESAIYEETGTYWAFYEGDAYAAQGIDLTPIADGAHYQLVNTKG